MKQPLAYRMRPNSLDDIVGQNHLLEDNKILRKMVEKQFYFSMILYGPAGSGKTTVASVLVKELGVKYHFFNAVTGNKKDLDMIFEESKYFQPMFLIIDEIHRLNKDKQDLLLPYLENGTIYIIGATTANPYHAINIAIRSRCQLLEIKLASSNEIEVALLRALQSEKGLNNEYQIEQDAINLLVKSCNGDIRFALNILELASIMCEDQNIQRNCIEEVLQKRNLSFAKDGDEYCDTLSAFQKSIRGSDVNAALYYLAILISADDMESICRRLSVCAYEDIGLANPSAVSRAIQAIETARKLGFPEARIPLSYAVIDLTLSPKSKSCEHAIDKALQVVDTFPCRMPNYLKFSPVNQNTYENYDYQNPSSWVYLQYLPNTIKNEQFYFPEQSSSYENTLAANYKKLSSIQRTSNIQELNQRYKKNL